jgi:hypothetical protein
MITTAVERLEETASGSFIEIIKMESPGAEGQKKNLA